MSEPPQAPEPFDTVLPDVVDRDIARAAELVEEKAALPPRPATMRRLVLLVVAFVVLFVVGWALGLDRWLDADRIRALVEPAGAWGFLIFLGLWAVGTTAHVPSVAFIAVAALLWGPMVGAAVSYAAAMLTVSTAFAVVRKVGGPALAAVERPWMKKLLARLEQHPIVTVALVRMTPLFLAPVLSYALALTPIRYRDFSIGSALGILPGVVLISAGTNAIFAWFGW